MLRFNDLRDNDKGLNLDEGMPPEQSSNNEIYLNNFVNNVHNIYSFISTNLWTSKDALNYQYRGKSYRNNLGNYWSDGRGTDSKGDGISDIPHRMGQNKDDHPLMETFDKYKVTSSLA